MNSDIGSDEDSSSVSDDEVGRVGAAPSTTATANPSPHRPSPPVPLKKGTPPGAAGVTPSIDTPRILPKIVESTRNSPPQYSLHVRTNGLEDVCGPSTDKRPVQLSPKRAAGLCGDVGGDPGSGENAEDPFALWYMRAFQVRN